MRVLIDTNVLFSALFRSGSIPHQAYVKAVSPQYNCLVCEQSFDELSESFIEKFPGRAAELEHFIFTALAAVEIIPIPETAHPDETLLRDPDDALILRAAIAANADIIVSGDLDFLESNVTTPIIMKAADFFKMEYPE